MTLNIKPHGIKINSFMTLRIIALGIMTLIIKINSLMTLRIMALSMTSHCIKLNETENYGTQHNDTHH